MSGRGHRRNRHQRCRGSGLSSFFEGRPSPLDRPHRGPPTANPPRVPSLDEEVHSDDKIFREIEEERVRVAIPPIRAYIGRPVVGEIEFIRRC